MCKRMNNFHMFFLVSSFLILDSAKAASPIIADTLKYPRAVVSPAAPVVGESIKLHYILGMYPDGCVPNYKTDISKTVLESYPPIIKFSLKYEEIPSDRKDMGCITVMTAYGPSFDLGRAETGTYEIYIDSKLVTQFKVTTLVPLKFSPEKPVEGDSVIISQILGYGSSSCSPLYKSLYELSLENNDQYTIKLTYTVTERSDQEFCTADYQPYGPEWKIPPLKAGHYNIYLNNKLYSNLTVQKNDILPAYVSIEGKVSRGGLIDAMRNPYIAQCTVAVITFQKYSSGDFEKIEITCHFGITDANGKYIMDKIPGSIFKSNSFIAAVKGDSVGYVKFSEQLKEHMIFNLSILDKSKIEDSVLAKESDDIIRAFKAMFPLSVNNKALLMKKQPLITAVTGGFQLTNPASQTLTITAFSVNGKKIWSTNERLTSGNHRFSIPAISSGIVLIKVKGESCNFSRVLKVTR